MSEAYPILEFDPSRKAIIEPSLLVKGADAPERAVICFWGRVMRDLPSKYPCKQLADLHTEAYPHPVYELDWDGEKLAVFLPGVGAALAVVLTEEMIARGCRKFIACGSAGVLDGEITRGHVVVPSSAVRDEGTSYHYAPPSREIAPSGEAVAAIEAALEERDIPYVLGKTWTTDGFYRETPDLVRRRKAEGCLTVEMEAASLFAVAQFRGVPLGFILSAGDDVSGEKWDDRGWLSKPLDAWGIFELAVEACLRL